MAKAAAAQVTSPNAFINRSDPPTDEQLSAALGHARTLWDQLLAVLSKDYGVAGREWTSYSRKAGWSLRVKRGERNIVYLSPSLGGFRASFALGDKAVQAALRSDFPPNVMRIIKVATKYAEGTAVRLEVHDAADIATVVQLAKIKLAN